MIGCIRKLKIGRQTVELHEQRDELVVKTKEIQECEENICSLVPCQNGGKCHVLGVDKFKCECPPTFTGDTCDKSLDVCQNVSCNGGECQYVNGMTICKCPKGRKGDYCELSKYLFGFKVIMVKLIGFVLQ